MGKRRSKEPVITFGHYRVFTFGSDEELIRSFGSIEDAEKEWTRVRSTFLKAWNLWGMPEAWWRFEPGVPDELRVGPSAASPGAASMHDSLDGPHRGRARGGPSTSVQGAPPRSRELDRARRTYLAMVGIDPTPPVGRPFLAR